MAAAIALGGGGIVVVTNNGGGGPVALTANLWVDTNGGTCVRQASAAAYADAAACSTFDGAFAAASAGDVVRIKTGSYGDQNLTARSNTGAQIQFRADGAVTFAVLNLRGADRISFYGPFIGDRMKANSCLDAAASCLRSDNIAWSDLVLNADFIDEKAVDLMGAARGWTFRDFDICCTHNDKIVNVDNFFGANSPPAGLVGNQASDVVFEGGDVHSQTVDVHAGSGSDVHTECFWLLGPQSMVVRDVHAWGCNGTITMNFSDTGDALVPANLMLENSTFEPTMNDDGEDQGCTGQTATSNAYRGVNYIRNNLFQTSYCVTDDGPSRNITVANNVGVGPGCANAGWTYTSNRWTNEDCSASDVQDTSALASARFVDAPKSDAQRSNTQVGAAVHGNWHYITGAAHINAGATTSLTADSEYAPRTGSFDQGPFEFGASIPSNLPPTANFMTPVAGTNVTFDAGSSIDPDGTISEYRWDWDNNGTNDTTTSSSTTTHTTAVNDVVRLTVVDDGGSVSAEKIVQVLA